MKALGWIIGLAALLIVAIGLYVVMNSGALLERAIESYGSDYLGAPVEISEASVSLTESSAAIDGLVIGNPPGYAGPPAFQLNNIAMTLDTDQLSSDLIVLKEVVIDGAQVAALVEGRQSNLGQLMDNLNARIGTEQEEPAESEVKLIIDRLDFTNAQASVDSNLLGQAAVDIPDVHLEDIGRQSNGATVGEVLKQVLEPVVRAVTRRLVEGGVDLQGVREQLEDSVRSRGGELEQRGREALDSGLRGLHDALGPGEREQPEDPPEQQQP